MVVTPDYTHISQFDREQLAQLGEDIQKAASGHGRKMLDKKGEARDVCLATFNLGVAIANFAKLNGHLTVWAGFNPQLFDGDDLTITEVGSEQT